jgi:hypothetical protein
LINLGDFAMFKKNTDHVQKNLFGLFNSLPPSLQKDVKASSEYHFYNLIFCNIPEDLFAKLYSDKKSRPNSPVNAMVASFILMQRNHWTYEQLFDAIKFNILTKIALGLDAIDDIPFCAASLFNFQNRLNDHFEQTGRNLLEQVFDQLTEEQLKALKLKTNIQRTDSFLAASNIRNYSRLQLLIELVIRIHRVLSDEDKQRFAEKFQAYINKSSGQYIYHLQAAALPHELQKIAQLYQWIYENLYTTYAEFEIFKIFERVYTEHFTVVKDKVTVNSSEQLHSGCLQSPDDVDATYRDKNGNVSKGQVINVTETAHPDNPINLLTDVAVNRNNSDDSQVLGERLAPIMQKTPDLEELHFDGAFGSSANDEQFDHYDVTPIQTAIRGRQSAVNIDIEQVSANEYQVSCPQQTVSSQPTRQRHKAEFDLAPCQQCPHRHQCPAITMKQYKVFYFSHQDYLARRRQHRIHEIPKERRTLRNNVEATVKEFVCKMPGKKLKVRGAFKAAVFAYSVAIAINFGRIYRLMLDNPEYFEALFCFIFKIVNEQVKFMKFLYRLWLLQLILTKNLVTTRPPGEKWQFETRCFQSRLINICIIGIGRDLTASLLPHHPAYGSRTRAVRLVRLFPVLNGVALLNQSSVLAVLSITQDFDSDAMAHVPI